MLDAHDHRKLANQLDLFHMQPEAPGMVFWHPRGFVLLRVLEEAIRREMARQGLAEVRSPQILRQAVWEASGHWEHFREGMFVVEDERSAALKPVSCPAHLYIAKARNLSYRDLPYRVGEIGLVHRNEQSGNLHGLFRLRQFSQDDGHILCEPKDVRAEVARFCQRVHAFYRAFDLGDVVVGFSSRPAERLGDDALWDEAEAMLRDAASFAGLELVEQPGEGAFYGPKLELVLRDRIGRPWQCGTIQLDLVMPERFDVSYVDADDRRRRPALLHRALMGSLERFLGIVLESYEGQLPPWLAPEQVLILPVHDAQHAYARHFAERLEREGLRPRLDLRNESLGRRIVGAHELGIPIIAVIGPKEVASGHIALRQGRARDLLPQDAALAALRHRSAPPL